MSKPVGKRKVWRYVLGAIVLGVLGMGTYGYFTFHPLLSFNPTDVPPITTNPVQLDQIFAVSRFRSDAGHDYSMNSWDGETCRSMKNYFNWSQNSANNMPVRSTPTPDHPNIQVYAPFDGVISANVAEQTPIGTQVHIAAAKNPAFFVCLFHIDLLPSLHVGSRVKSGELVGTIGPMDGMDVSYEAHLVTGRNVYLSIFQYMTPEAFAPYAALGYKQSNFVLTKEQADALGYQCNGEQFVHTSAPGYPYGNPLEGYVQLKPNPYAGLTNRQNVNQGVRGNMH